MSCQGLEALLSCRAALVIGTAGTPLERGLHAGLRSSGARIEQVDEGAALAARPASFEEPWLAVAFDPRLLDVAAIEGLATGGCRGVIWTGNEPIADALLRAARPHQLRFVGPRSAGFLRGGGIKAGAFPVDVEAGGLALIAQSGSIAAAAVDWAVGRDIGFSWAVTTGAEADADVADFLDYAALDSATRAVVLQLGRLQGARKFMSAARACARLKPVVVLQSRVGGRDPVRSAAFARAGLVECETLDGLFDALAAVARVPARPKSRVLTLGNGAGMCALGVDAVLRHGLTAAEPGAIDPLRALAPRARALAGAVDLGPHEPETLVPVCRELLARDNIDYLLLVHSPVEGVAHEASVDALLAAKLGPRIVTVWLGLKSAVEARRRSVEGGFATFVTAGQAARALRYRWLHGRMRELLMQTPPPHPHEQFALARAQSEIAGALAAGLSELEPAATGRLLDCYALPAVQAPSSPLRFELEVARHRELGMHLSLAAASSLLRTATGLGFPPLDTLLARRMIEALELDLPESTQGWLVDALLAISQMALDLAPLARLRLSLSGEGGRLPGARLELDRTPPPERQRCALPAYPGQYCRTLALRNGRGYLLRPVLPEDEPALVQLLQSLRLEEVRLRFFASIRYFSHEMAARMTQIDYDREYVLVVAPCEQPEQLCALAQLVSDPYGEAGEYAVLVHHDHTGAGLGAELMRELLEHGRRTGLKRVYGEVLQDNGPMLALVRRFGFHVELLAEDPLCLHVAIEI